ncbi:serine acetyltransferase [Clostridiaceae bacterium HFYG-1003]|nr:serine acetyltransferase [Clostridiaceae bacterium HFYG-1003]
MIKTKSDLLEYMAADKIALGRKSNFPSINDYIWRYEILLRKCEYYSNCQYGLIRKLVGGWYRWRRSKLGAVCGFSIPINTVDKGLCIAHIGPIIISPHAHLGENCRIHVGVNIGADARAFNAAPQIGNNVYFAPGAKLFGAIKISDNIAIGANAVVNRSFEQVGISIGGIPAKKISEQGTEGILS